MTIKEQLLDFGNPKFLDKILVEKIENEYGSPCYIYSEKELEERANEFLSFPNAYGLTVRYAMKSSPNKNILKMFDNLGIQIDASSAYECYRAIDAGIKPNNIQLTAQELPENLEKILALGIIYNATSLHQLEEYGKISPSTEISIRINPGVGSGGTNRTNVGGPSSSFGIWKDYLDDVKKIANKYKLKITKIHTHIGSGSDPLVWSSVSSMSLDIVEKFKNVEVLNLGGGFKVGRIPSEQTVDLEEIGEKVKNNFIDFHKKTGRKIKLEVEPGTYLVANSASLVCKIQDLVDTGDKGFNFIKLNAGMTEITRISMYGAQHPIYVLNNEKEKVKYIVSGHCCESGDIFTPAIGDPEGLLTRSLNKANIGDNVVIDGSGAYCSGMNTKNYNSFPESAELLLRKDGTIVEIRKRQKLEDIWKNETNIIK